jgi:hypothetical protein
MARNFRFDQRFGETERQRQGQRHEQKQGARLKGGRYEGKGESARANDGKGGAKYLRRAQHAVPLRRQKQYEMPHIRPWRYISNTNYSGIIPIVPSHVSTN